MLKVFLQVLFGIGMLAAFVVALLVAWWIALLLVLGLSIWLGVRRFFGAKTPQGRKDLPATLEGEYRVERGSERVEEPRRGP